MESLCLVGIVSSGWDVLSSTREKDGLVYGTYYCTPAIFGFAAREISVLGGDSFMKFSDGELRQKQVLSSLNHRRRSQVNTIPDIYASLISLSAWSDSLAISVDNHSFEEKLSLLCQPRHIVQ